MLNLVRISVAVVAVPLVAFAGPPQVGGPFANRLSKADMSNLKFSRRRNLALITG
jgi:hypothetical protein